MEKTEAKLVDLKADELKKASSQRGEQTPTFQLPDLPFHSQQLQQPQQGADSDSRHTAPTESPLPKFSQSVGSVWKCWKSDGLQWCPAKSSGQSIAFNVFILQELLTHSSHMKSSIVLH
ncbi:hypothetical protein XENOCAPTIV_028324 [Xenoophorus captivus]|uniref:Uncharacterized protein n=1 Tax=Xenoophorus captivus TaxID=1517983 RepID=A0ABV0S0T0_9TELE